MHKQLRALLLLACTARAEALVHCVAECPAEGIDEPRIVCLRDIPDRCDTITTGRHVPMVSWLDEIVRKAQHRCVTWEDSAQGWTGMETCLNVLPS